ncbi:hypothetical protein [Selenomonas ruminantium]|uniref:hypothetical protein n=1 Tax=Selenomonas ruminantium TaxID=971 RepID=UPI0005A538F8|nr:hypothetical protein [Selenomonas ruminantium]
MSGEYINIYKNNPTAGGTDGTVVSTDGDYTSPINVTLDASISESKKIKLAVRCESGYETSGNTVISDNGDVDDRWKLSLTENGTYADSITISTTIDDTNTVFWAQASSDSTETPTTDRSVSLRVATVIAAV